MPRSSQSILMLPAALALASALVPPAAAQETVSDYGYPAYGYHAYGYRTYHPQVYLPEGAPPPPGAAPAMPQAVLPPAAQQPPAAMPPVAAEPAAPAAPRPVATVPAVPTEPGLKKTAPAKPAVVKAEPAVPAIAPATFIARANEPALPETLKRGGKQSLPEVARLQILLDRANVSPGVIDGVTGSNLAKAVSALENMNGLPSTGRMGPEIDAILAAHGAQPVLVPYVITAADVAGPFVPVMPKDYGEMAQLAALAYRGPQEELAERFHMDEGFLKQLNPGAQFREGETITVADIGPPSKTKVYHLIADSATRQLLGYDQAWDLVVAYPATIGSADMPSPSGTHAVKAIAVDPVYWYRPKVNFQQGKNDKPLKLAPGPNNPVGAVWIGLDKPTYGIHGSPEPSRIDKTNSHGCLRLTNWDARELARLVRPGVVVEFVDPTRTASVAPTATPAAPAAQPMPPAVQ